MTERDLRPPRDRDRARRLRAPHSSSAAGFPRSASSAAGSPLVNILCSSRASSPDRLEGLSDVNFEDTDGVPGVGSLGGCGGKGGRLVDDAATLPLIIYTAAFPPEAFGGGRYPEDLKSLAFRRSAKVWKLHSWHLAPHLIPVHE